MTVAERRLEDAIECALLAYGPDACPGEGRIHEEPTPYGDAPGGYSRRSHTDYDRERCLDPEVALEFVYATQPKAWDTFAKQHGSDARERFLSPNAFGFATAYLWDDVWARTSVLDLVEHFVRAIDEEDASGGKTGKRCESLGGSTVMPRP